MAIAATAPQTAPAPPTGILGGANSLPYNQPVATPTAPVVNYNPALLSTAVNDVTSSGSPIMERAAAVANQDSNSRGLLNSSMAIGAAQNAVLGAALPIAQGDVNAENAARAQNTQAQNAEIMSQLGQENQVQLAGLNTKYNAFLNSNNNASSLYNNVIQQIGQIQNNPNMDGATKSSAIAQELSLLESGLSMSSGITGLNLGAGLNFNTNAGQLGTTNYPANYAQNPDFMAFYNGLPGATTTMAGIPTSTRQAIYQQWQAMSPAARAAATWSSFHV